MSSRFGNVERNVAVGWEIIQTFCSRSHGRRKRGGGGDASPAVEKSAGNVPPETVIFSIFFLKTFANFVFSNIFEIK